MDSQSLLDPVELIYDRRIRGALMISVADDQHCHLHGGCWLAICGLSPARLMAAIPKEFAAAAMIQALGRFTVSVSSADDQGWQGRFYHGDWAVVQDPKLFVRSPAGAPVPRAAVGYVDFSLLQAVDLGDFLLVVGEARGGSLLQAAADNITVNAIVAVADPRGAEETVLPFAALAYNPKALDRAPCAAFALSDQGFLDVFGRRHWGLYLASTVAADRSHLMVSGWGIQASHRPARLVVAAAASSPVGALWREPGASVLISLLSGHDRALVQALAAGDDLAAMGGLIVRADGLASTEGALATFQGHATAWFEVGDMVLAEVTVELAEDTSDQGANLMVEEVVAEVGWAGHLDPGTDQPVSGEGG
ncbi:MAG: flavin reductase [Sulfobacillus sp.]